MKPYIKAGTIATWRISQLNNYSHEHCMMCLTGIKIGCVPSSGFIGLMWGNTRHVTGTTRAPHGNPTGFPRLAFRDPEGSQLLLLPLRLLRQSLIDHLRDTVQSPYLLHPHSSWERWSKNASAGNRTRGWPTSRIFESCDGNGQFYH
jgi:hypothetical protein